MKLVKILQEIQVVGGKVTPDMIEKLVQRLRESDNETFSKEHKLTRIFVRNGYDLNGDTILKFCNRISQEKLNKVYRELSQLL